MAYVDADGTPAFGGMATFSSSRAFLDLSNNPGCSVIEAYLTWGGNISTGAANYNKRDSVYMRANGSSLYKGFKADFTTNGNFSGVTTYQCYKNITNDIRVGGEGDYWVANVIASTGAANLCAGWSIVVIYGDETLPLRNLTIYKGYGNISSATGGLTLPISGFFTPPGSAPVNVKLGIFAFEGDQGTVGDSLKFNGVGTNYLSVTDGLNHQDNFFNSSIDIAGVSVNGATAAHPGNPSYPNTLGFDADLITLNNSTKAFLGNSASNARLRLTTGGDQYWPFMITTAIDVFEPILVVEKTFVIDNGNATAQLGDIITYNLKVFNKGTDPSNQVVLIDSLYGAMDYVAGSARIITGPNSGIKTDAIGDDQVDVNGKEIKFRLGATANGTTGGNMGITAVDSVTTISFKVKITNDCQIFRCTPTVFNTAFVNYVGFTSGQVRSTLSSPDGLDAFGCPIQGATRLTVSVPACTPIPDTTFNQCVPYNLSALSPTRPGFSTFYNGSFTPVSQATATGTYYAIKQLYPGCNDTIQINFTQTCIVPIILVQFDAAYVNGFIQLDWMTQTEANNKFFEIERSIDGINFEKINQMDGALNSSTLKTYRYFDNNFPLLNKLYYRIAQVDLDGSKKYTPIRVITIKSNKPLWIAIEKVIPNPVIDNTTLKIMATDNFLVRIKLFDLLGNIVYSNHEKIKSGYNLVQIRMNDLQSGMYFMEIIDTKSGQSITQKIIKQ